MIAWIKQRRAPPASNQTRRLHIQPRDHVESLHLRRRRRRLVHGRRRVHIVRNITLTVLFGVAARVRAALLPVPVVRFHVFGQVIRPHEPLVADGTGESLLARVRPEVALQLVGPGEPLAAKEPVADERPLAGVPPQMGLQMRRLPVHLPASRYVAAVDVLLPQVNTRRSQSFGLLAVGAVASGATGVAPLRARRRHLRGQAAGPPSRGRGRARRVQPERSADRLRPR